MTDDIQVEAKINKTQAAIAKFLGVTVEEAEQEPISKFGDPRVYKHSKDHPEAELWVTHSLYHWLNEATVYDAAADADWQRYITLMSDGKHGDNYFWDAAQRFPAYYAWLLAEREAEDERIARRNGSYAEPEVSEVEAKDYHVDPRGPYGDKSGPVGQYTYNEDNCLERDIHYVYWEQDNGDDSYVVVSFGGTKTILLRTSVDGGGTVGWFDYNRYTIWCDNPDCHIYWSSGSGVEWNDSDYVKHQGVMRELKEYVAMEGTGEDAARLCGMALKGSGDPDTRPAIVIDDTTNPTTVWCPHCGKGKLQPSLY